MRHAFFAGPLRIAALAVALLVTTVTMVLTVLVPRRQWRRVVAPLVARGCAQGILRALGVRVTVDGHASVARGLLVANHLSWLDIVVTLATWRCAFVAKREVRAWPVIGTFADALGVVWIDRSRLRDVRRVLPLLERTLREGATVMLFPEGTTTDGHQVLPFRSALFQAARAADVPIVPLAFSAHSDHGDASALSWVGSETLVANVPRVAALRGAAIRVAVETPRLARAADRKYLARTSRDAIVTALSSRGRIAMHGALATRLVAP